MANTSVEMILGMSFLILSNANVLFSEWELTWKSYTAIETLLTTKRVEIINKKVFAKTALDENIEAFMVHIIFFSLNKPMILIHLAKEA